jgi:hypothetical protein
MRKRRSDSPWNKLTEEQQRQMDRWFFVENLAYAEILKRAENDFGVKTSRPSLAGYRAHRKKLLEARIEEVLEGIEEEPEEEKALHGRLGAGVPLDELKDRTIYCAAMAAYKLAVAEPEKMQVKDLRVLVKMLHDDRRLQSHLDVAKIKTEAFQMASMLKLKKEAAKFSTPEETKQRLSEQAELAKFISKKRIEVAEDLKKWVAEGCKREEPATNAGTSQAVPGDETEENGEVDEPRTGGPDAVEGESNQTTADRKDLPEKNTETEVSLSKDK